MVRPECVRIPKNYTTLRVISLDSDGRAANGAAVGNGVYFYRMTVGGAVLTRRMVVIR